MGVDLATAGACARDVRRPDVAKPARHRLFPFAGYFRFADVGFSRVAQNQLQRVPPGVEQVTKYVY